MITAVNDVLKCATCGMVVEVVVGGDCTECSEPPVKLEANTVDGAHERHVPVIEKVPDGFLVKIGAVPHPMTEKHSILYVEVIGEKMLHRHYFAPGEAPEAFFNIKYHSDLKVRAYCNIHGLWEL